ncbi:MAG: hypothetical protein ACK4WD_09670 [Flavobacteriales bacterium]|jgi:hypothetical protein
MAPLLDGYHCFEMAEMDLFKLLDIGARGLIPLIVICAIYHWENLSKRAKRFVFYLSLYFIINLPTFFDGDDRLRWSAFSIATLLESLFLYHFVSEHIKGISNLRFLWMGFIVMLWFFSFGKLWFPSLPLEVTPFFNTIVNAMLALLAAVVLFKTVSSEHPLDRNIEFWLFCGVFVYKLSTVLLVAFIPFSFHSDVWYLHSLYFIFGGVFYIIGFCRTKSVAEI